MGDRHMHDRDPEVAAQQQLESLDELHYALCRLHHDHQEDGLSWEGMRDTTSAVSNAAITLMREFPRIQTVTYNRDWYDLRQQYLLDTAKG
jgi:hypothetical protein